MFISLKQTSGFCIYTAIRISQGNIRKLKWSGELNTAAPPVLLPSQSSRRLQASAQVLHTLAINIRRKCTRTYSYSSVVLMVPAVKVYTTRQALVPHTVIPAGRRAVSTEQFWHRPICQRASAMIDFVSKYHSYPLKNILTLFHHTRPIYRVILCPPWKSWTVVILIDVAALHEMLSVHWAGFWGVIF